MRIIKLLILTLFVVLYADSNSNLFSQPYVASTQEHLYEKFDYSSDIESMDCNSYLKPTICRFNTSYDVHGGTMIQIMLVSFFLMFIFLYKKRVPLSVEKDDLMIHGDDPFSDMYSEQKKNEIRARPTYPGRALIVLILAILAIKYIRSGDTNKIIDFTKQALIVEDREGNQLQSYPLRKLQNIEILKYTDDDYTHYELNLRFENQRINLYAGKDDLHCYIAAKALSDDLHKSVLKIRTGF